MFRKRRASSSLPFILGLFAGLLLLWWVLRRPVKREALVIKSKPVEQRSLIRAARSPQEARVVETAASLTETAPPQADAPTSAEPLSPPAQSKPAAPDDLTPIEGIGPKINKVLHDAGITTFNQLAKTEVSRLEQILNQAGLRLAKADTWPEQAKLAAAGDWEGLKQLQGQLKGGRRRS